MSVARTGYLFIYNSIQWSGWIAILVDRIFTLDQNYLSPPGKWLLYFFQTAAILEIVHAVTGLVRASPSTTFVQVISRLQVLLVHAYVIEARESFGLIPMVLAWGLVEVVRYLYLALNLLHIAPRALLWLRYSLFYVLYPMGVYGEMRVLFDALPALEKNGILSIPLPNMWNFAFSYASFVKVMLYVIYLPGLYMQYTHMMKQRKKALSALPKPSGESSDNISLESKKEL